MNTIIIDGIEYDLVPKVKEEVFSDWRLPTIKELNALVNYDKCEPASDLEDTKSDYYWSSSPHVSDSSYTWYVCFNGGQNGWGYKSCSNLVRCVRDGIDGLEWSATAPSRMTFDEAIEYAKNLIAPVYYKG